MEHIRNNTINVNQQIESIRNNDPSFTDPQLHGMDLGDAEAKYLAVALRGNRTLTGIGLQNNQISDDGAKALADALKVNTTLVGILLGGNQISDEGAMALADALRVNTRLSEMVLRENPINDGSILDDIESLCKRNKVRIYVGCISDECVQFFSMHSRAYMVCILCCCCHLCYD